MPATTATIGRIRSTLTTRAARGACTSTRAAWTGVASTVAGVCPFALYANRAEKPAPRPPKGGVGTYKLQVVTRSEEFGLAPCLFLPLKVPRGLTYFADFLRMPNTQYRSSVVFIIFIVLIFLSPSVRGDR